MTMYKSEKKKKVNPTAVNYDKTEIFGIRVLHMKFQSSEKSLKIQIRWKVISQEEEVW